MSLFRRRVSSDPKPVERGSSSTRDEGEHGNLRSRLKRSRSAFARGLGSLLSSGAQLDDDTFEELEDLMITTDLGVGVAQRISEKMQLAAREHRLGSAERVLAIMRREIARILTPYAAPLSIDCTPYVILVVGVNGVGKTTTIAKIAKRLQDQGHSVMLAAGDTFRAAAVEQLQRWGERLEIPVVAQPQGSDAAAVAHDALVSARTRGVDVLIIDTAGRLHTQGDLMEQMKKIKRVLGKLETAAPQKVLQVLDAGTGQNALSQLKHFQDAVAVNGLCLTKLDGTAKGGVLVAIAEQFQLPIHYIGVGEGFDDLREFDAQQFAAALIPETLAD